MQGIDKIADKLVSAIDQNSDYKIHDADKKYVKSKSGTVVTYDELSSTAIVKFPDIENNFKFYNKSGELLKEGNTVKVEYTNNLSQGIIVAKYGVWQPNETDIIPYVSEKIQNIEENELGTLGVTILDLDFTVDGVDSDVVLTANQLIDVTSSGTVNYTYLVDGIDMEFAPSQILTTGKHIVPHIIPIDLIKGEHNLTIKQISETAKGRTKLGGLQGVMSGQISGINIEIPPNYNMIFKIVVEEDNTELTFPMIAYSTDSELTGEIYWGDGQFEPYTNTKLTHTYTTAGEYNIVVTNPYTVIGVGGNPPYISSIEGLQSIELSENVIRIWDDTFNGVSATSIKLGSNIQQIGMRAFAYNNLINLNINSNSIKIIGDTAFAFSTTLQNVKLLIPNADVGGGNAVFNSCINLQKAEISYGNPTSPPVNWFYGCTNLKKVTISSPTPFVGESFFSGCTSLSEVILANSIKKIGRYAFASTTALKGISLPNSLTEIGDNAFNGSGIIDISLPASLTSIGSSAFAFTYIKNIVVPNAVKNIGNSAFANCRELSSFTFSQNVEMLGTSILNGCSGLTTVNYYCNLPIPYGCFGNCSSLTTVNFGETSNITSIGSSAFQTCSSLSDITIPSSVTTIDYNAFYGCSSLKSINIPDGVTSIGTYAFLNTGLTAVTLPENCTYYKSSFPSGCVVTGGILNS